MKDHGQRDSKNFSKKMIYPRVLAFLRLAAGIHVGKRLSFRRREDLGLSSANHVTPKALNDMTLRQW